MLSAPDHATLDEELAQRPHVLPVGSDLSPYGLELLADQGLQPVFLWVLLENTRARRFYEHYGFAADGAQEDYEVGGARVPEVRYRRDA